MTSLVALWLPSTLQLLLAWYAKRSANSWLYPSAFYNLYWGLAFLVPAFAAPDYDIWPVAAWFVLLTGVVLHGGAAIGAQRRRTPAGRVDARPFNPYALRYAVPLLTVMTVLGSIAILIIVQAGGYSLGEIVDLNNLAKLAQTYSIQRYSLAESQPLPARVLTGFAYVGSLLSGITFAVRSSKRVRLLGCLPTLTVLGQSILLTTRTPFLYSLVLMLASYMTVSVLQRQDKNLTRGKVFQIVVAAVVFAAFIFSLQLLRENKSIDNGASQLAKTRAAAFGSPAVFSHWLRDGGWASNTPTLGAGLFGGVFDLLGIAPRVQGLWADVDVLGPDEQVSNVHTVFRQLIEDFTIPGAVILVFLCGMASGTAYRRLRDGRVEWLTVLVCFYVFVMPSYLASVYNYNSILLAVAFFAVLVMKRPLGAGLMTTEWALEQRRRIRLKTIRRMAAAQ